MATAIGNLFIRIGADTKKLDADLRAAQRRLKSSAKEFKSIGADLSQTVSLPIIAIGAGAVKAFGDLEALQKGLISVMGSAEAAGAEFTKLKEVAKLPGLGLEEAVQGSVNLQSAGFSADQAREALLQFGNALATVGKGKNELNLVVLALTQLQNKSSGFGQDLRQLVEQLPQLRGALTNAFGTADSEAIANLGVTGKQVVETLITEFGKLPRVSGGIKNAFENLSDSTKIAFANLGEALNKSLNIEGLLNKISNFVTKAAEAFGKLDPSIQKAIIAFAGIATAIGPILFIGGQLASSFSAIIAAMKTVGLTATLSLGPVGIAIAAIAAAAYILYVKWEDIVQVMDEVGFTSIDLSGALDGLKDVLILINIPLRFMLDLMGNIVGSFVRLAGVITGKISFKQFIDSSIEAFRETGERAANSFVDAFTTETKKVSLNIAGSTQGTDRLSGYAKLRGEAAAISLSGGTTKTKTKAGKPENQFSTLPEDVAIKAGLQATGITLPTTAREIVTLEALIPKLNFAKKSAKDLEDEVTKLGEKMQQAFDPRETLSEKLKRIAEQIQKVAQVATSIFAGLFNPLQGVLDAQNQAIDVRRENEKRAVSESITDEDLKAKKLAEIDKKYDAEKRKLQRKQAIANKAAGIFDATISAAQAVARALSLGPAGLVLAPIMAALGAAQIAAIAATPLPSLAIGTNRVNRSGLAEIHRGEAIVPADVVQGGFNVGGGGFVDKLVAEIQGHVIRVSQRNSEFLSSRLIA